MAKFCILSLLYKDVGKLNSDIARKEKLILENKKEIE